MKALTFQGKESVSYESLVDPAILQPTDAIVKVELCAICGSDLHVYHEREKGLDHGTAMGHEFMGEVVEAGTGVKRLKVGDKVMSPFTTSCGNCFYCNIGLSCRCVSNQLFGWREKSDGLHGGQAEFLRVPLADSTLVKIPEHVTDEEALMLGDIIPTGFFCALQAEVKPGGTYAIIGCGPVGLMAALGALELGAEKIYALDVESFRLDFARKLGAIPVTANKDGIDFIRNETEGRGVDGVMEAVGSSVSISLGYDLLRPGGVLSAVGVCTDDRLPFSPEQAYNKNITYKVGRCPARSLMPRLIRVVQSRKYNYTSVITHRMNLSEGADGYAIFSAKTDNCLKVVLKP